MCQLWTMTDGMKEVWWICGVDNPKKNRVTFNTVYPKKYAHGFCFAVLCCGYTLTDFPISIRPISLALWQSDDCPSARPAKQPWRIWINTSFEFIMNDCITTTKQSSTKPCAYFLGYTVYKIQMTLFRKSPWRYVMRKQQLIYHIHRRIVAACSTVMI